MKWRERTLDEIADLICGNTGEDLFFVYRSSSYLTVFSAMLTLTSHMMDRRALTGYLRCSRRS